MSIFAVCGYGPSVRGINKIGSGCFFSKDKTEANAKRDEYIASDLATLQSKHGVENVREAVSTDGAMKVVIVNIKKTTNHNGDMMGISLTKASEGIIAQYMVMEFTNQ